MQPKAKTLQERMGFRDDELTTPKHDEIMLWLDENAERLGVSIASQHGHHKSWAHMARFEYPELEECPSFRNNQVKVIRRTWEQPIKAANEFIVGFVDMLIEIDTTVRIGAGKKDGKPFWGWHDEPRKLKALVEVKPTISSLGDLIRQVRLYESTNTSAGMKGFSLAYFYVCCPDNRFEKQLASQGIGFIKAEV